MRWISAWALAMVLGWTAVVARADDAADQRAFVAASERLAAGDPAGARAQFEALARAAPLGPWADDALAEAATLAEQAGDRAAARQLWTTLVRDHGDGRLARRAQARLAALAAAGGDDGRFDAVAVEHERLLRAASQLEDPQPALRELGALLTARRDYPRWSIAALGLGEAWARIGARGQAREWMTAARAAAGEPSLQFRVELALARLAADGGDLDGARARIAGLVPPDAVAAAAREEALRELDRRQFRRAVGRAARVALLGLVALALLWLVWFARRHPHAARHWWRPPIEVVFLLPVAVGFALVAETGNSLAARAVEHLLIGSLVITWLASLVARTLHGVSRWWRLGFVVAVVVAVASWAWIVVDRDALLELLIETWRSGHDLG